MSTDNPAATPDGPLVEVALPLPLHRTFTYRVDQGEAPQPGTRVRVPFRRGERIGWVVGTGSGAGLTRIRSILDVAESEPSVPPDLLRLARWMAEYYACSLGIALRALVPSSLVDESRDHLTILAGSDGPGPSLDGLAERPRKLLEELEGRGGRAPVRALRRALGGGALTRAVEVLEARGLVRRETVPPREPSVRTRKVVGLARWIESLEEREGLLGRAPRQRACYEALAEAGGRLELAELLEGGSFSRSVVDGLREKGIVELHDEEVVRDPFAAGEDEPDPHAAGGIRPNPEQARVLEEMTGAMGSPNPTPFLLHGVTGSGKTLVYIELLREVVERQGRTALVLVPEISLTPQTVRRFRAAFGDRVAVLHSALSEGERYDAWRQLRSGRYRIAVGARSAVFAPLPDLGAVIVDEEHDGSYKQSEAPRYQARDVAVVRASLSGAVCVLGSATPALESWANAGAGKFRRLELPERASGRTLPPVQVVDVRRGRTGADGKGGGSSGQGGAQGGGPPPILSAELHEAVQARLDREEQALLLLNRRGYAPFVQCMACGDVRECPNCSVSMTYHRRKARLTCHHCRHEEAAPRRCHACGSDDLSFRGVGTEQVERAVVEAFPGARVARMDVDTTSGKWSHHEILGRVGRGEVDLLLGTQMVAKGLDFPGVTLVGVVNADVGLHLPDFRAGERTFQLLSQVAGRTGRGDAGGEVIVQTAVPDHYAVQAAVAHDYEGFARREMEERSSPAYPPHVRLANVVVSSPDPERVTQTAEEAVRWVQGRQSPGGSGALPELLGPAPAPIERLHGRWRWHFLLRGGSVRGMTWLLHQLQEDFEPSGGGDVRVVVDRDPTALL